MSGPEYYSHSFLRGDRGWKAVPGDAHDDVVLSRIVEITKALIRTDPAADLSDGITVYYHLTGLRAERLWSSLRPSMVTHLLPVSFSPGGIPTAFFKSLYMFAFDDFENLAQRRPTWDSLRVPVPPPTEHDLLESAAVAVRFVERHVPEESRALYRKIIGRGVRL